MHHILGNTLWQVVNSRQRQRKRRPGAQSVIAELVVGALPVVPVAVEGACDWASQTVRGGEVVVRGLECIKSVT